MNAHGESDAGARDMQALRRTAEHLAGRYAGTFSADMVGRYVFDSYAALSRTARVRTYLAAMAGHFAENRLRALARSKDATGTVIPRVLFVGPRNDGASRIAAALLARHAGEAVRVGSAGVRPGDALSPQAADALREAGVDPDRDRPQLDTDDSVRAADCVVVLGGEARPAVYPWKLYLEWDIRVPGDATPEQMRALVADIDRRVRDLWDRLRP